MSVGHLYATRGPVLEYQQHVGGGFETARRHLTEHMLQQMKRLGPGSHHLQVRAVDRALSPAPIDFRVRVQLEGPLLVITQLDRL